MGNTRENPFPEMIRRIFNLLKYTNSTVFVIIASQRGDEEGN